MQGFPGGRASRVNLLIERGTSGISSDYRLEFLSSKSLRPFLSSFVARQIFSAQKKSNGSSLDRVARWTISDEISSEARPFVGQPSSRSLLSEFSY